MTENETEGNEDEDLMKMRSEVDQPRKKNDLKG